MKLKKKWTKESDDFVSMISFFDAYFFRDFHSHFTIFSFNYAIVSFSIHSSINANFVAIKFSRHRNFISQNIYVLLLSWSSNAFEIDALS